MPHLPDVALLKMGHVVLTYEACLLCSTLCKTCSVFFLVQNAKNMRNGVALPAGVRKTRLFAHISYIFYVQLKWCSWETGVSVNYCSVSKHLHFILNYMAEVKLMQIFHSRFMYALAE